MIEQIKVVARDVSAFTDKHPLVTYVAIRVLTPPPAQAVLMTVWVGSMIATAVRKRS
jgi:hypothetical protein